MQDDYWLSYAVTAFLENFWYLVVAAFGAVVGSFLGVVIYRLPIIELTDPKLLPKGYSLSHPASYCPHCKHVLGWWENVPILGFLWLRGRCSDCKKPIPWRDFSMELLTATAWVAIFHRYNGDNPVAWVNVVLLALFASVLIAAVFIDLDHFIVPEALNRVGVVIGVARDLLVLGIAYLLLTVVIPSDFPLHWNAVRLWRDTVATHTYFGWLPRGFVGAALYAGVLWLVSFCGFLFYAREEGEPLGSVVRRFFTYEDYVADSDAATILPVDDAGHPTVAAAQHPENTSVVIAPENQEEVDDSPPIRLRFSPGFIVLLSVGFLWYVVGAWSLLAFVLPLLAFVTITRTTTESMGDALRRFFRSDDLPYEYDAPTAALGVPTTAPTALPADETLITGSNVAAMVWNAESPKTIAVGSEPTASHQSTAPVSPAAPLSFAEAQSEADQFAKEAESGTHGGMGLGDVKLAVAIGAILGPGQAMLSLIFAAFFGAVAGLILKSMHRKNSLRLAVPFVPFMAAGAFVCLLFGEQIITWYTSLYSSPATNQMQQDGPRILPNGSVELPSDARLRRAP